MIQSDSLVGNKPIPFTFHSPRSNNNDWQAMKVSFWGTNDLGFGVFGGRFEEEEEDADGGVELDGMVDSNGWKVVLTEMQAVMAPLINI
jgi:hypothetical protein